MRILIAEDDALLREGLALLLRGEGFEVSAVSDAEQFLTVFEETAPDAAVLDVRMPPTFTNEGLRAAIEVRKLRPGFPSWSFPRMSRIATPVNCWQEVPAGSVTCSRNGSARWPSSSTH